nr:hypothetical protein [uncultured Anaerocolumna sp.]
MTKEEIEERKEELRLTTSVPSILNRYGVKIKWNRCRGFCHDGKDLNMKVFETGCHCFVCGESMDIFDIVQHFENCDFWTAFELLGGTEKPSFTARVKANKAKRERSQKIVKEREEKAKLRQIQSMITAYRSVIASSKPFSYIWCYCQNKLQYQIYLLEYYTEKR